MVSSPPHLVDLDLAKIALSCHFALDLLCYKEEVLVSAQWYIGHHCPWRFWFVWHQCRPCDIKNFDLASSLSLFLEYGLMTLREKGLVTLGEYGIGRERELTLSVPCIYVSASYTWLRTPTLSIVSSPLRWQGFQLACSPPCLQGVLGQLVRQMLQGISLQQHGRLSTPRWRTTAMMRKWFPMDLLKSPFTHRAVSEKRFFATVHLLF